MENKIVIKETYTREVEGKCNCGSVRTIIKFENSSLSAFKHGNRFTRPYDRYMETNIFRCDKCRMLIEETFTETK